MKLIHLQLCSAGKNLLSTSTDVNILMKRTTSGSWADGERLLAKTFDAWRAEFRRILEDHRREIQDRLEKIEREIELV